MSDLYEKLITAVYEGENDTVVSLVEQALSEGGDPKEILDEGLVKGMDKVALDFKDGEMFVPEVLLSAEAMQKGNDILKPLMAAGTTDNKGTVVIGTVKGDLHDIGKRIVGMMLEGAGFKIVDLGMDIPSDSFVDAAKENDADIIGMSAMLTTTMPVMSEVSDKLKEEGMENIKMMVGGAPLNEQFADGISANYSYDAANAVEMANNLVK